MDKTKTTIIIDGDPSGAKKAVNETAELDKLKTRAESAASEIDSEFQEAILYDALENQKIPLISGRGKFLSRIIHHLKPLTNKRYFQFQNELELVRLSNRRKISEIYKPHLDLWKDLFIEREGGKETDSDVLSTESVQAINALTYYERMSISPDEDGEITNQRPNDSVYFGSMFSGAWLGLIIDYKWEFCCFDTLDEFRETQTKKKNLGFTPRASNTAERVFNFALPYISKVKGFTESKNYESLAAWQVVNTAYEVQALLLNDVSKTPFIEKIQGQ